MGELHRSSRMANWFAAARWMDLTREAVRNAAWLFACAWEFLFFPGHGCQDLPTHVFSCLSVFGSFYHFDTLDLYHSLQLVRSAGRRSPELFLGLENGLETKDLEWHVSLFENKYV